MQKILIADRSAQFCNYIAEKLKNRFFVKTCTNGQDALDMLAVEQPDLLIIELELPQIDGLRILRCLHNSDRAVPTVALTTCVNSSYVLQTLNYMGVEFMLTKPVTVAAVVNCAVEILNLKNQNQPNPEDELAQRLVTLGFRADLTGFAYLVEAIRLFSQDPTQQITKTIYPEVAKTFGVSAVSVERAIRSLVQKAWICRNVSVWSMFFSNTSNDAHAPSNSTFIARMAVKYTNRKVC